MLKQQPQPRKALKELARQGQEEADAKHTMLDPLIKQAEVMHTTEDTQWEQVDSQSAKREAAQDTNHAVCLELEAADLQRTALGDSARIAEIFQVIEKRERETQLARIRSCLLRPSARLAQTRRSQWQRLQRGVT